MTAYEELGAGRGVRLRALHECDAAQIGRGASWWWIVRGTRPPGSREGGRVGRHGGEKSAEESSADMACSPWGGGVVWLGAEAGGARVARPGGRSGGCFRSAHALVMKCLRRVGEGSTERVPQCARSHIEQVDLIPAQAVKAFLDSGARAACRANGCRSIGLNSEAEALMVWRQQRS